MTTGSERRLVLAASVVGNPRITELVAAAVDAGYDALSLWPAAGYGAAREHRHIIEDAGLFVFDVDALVSWIGPDDPGSPYFEEAPADVVWAAADALGATSVNVLLVGARGVPLDAVIERFAALADAAAERGARLTVEFGRGTAVPDLPTAAHVVADAGRANAGLLLDAWNLYWSGARPSDVGRLPGHHVHGLQLSDAPAERPEHLAHASRYHREMPGTGVADNAGLVATLDAIGSHGPLVVEAFNGPLLEQHGAAGYARLLADALRSVRDRATS
ncbi:MAG TPA: sugar phosphate isomerase/epimerase [Acidimicrobiales bacterium]|jgi:sugar phosphate isomerase/epimerase|nr:sugar phosphate isomerase/epimerase [Acidimicrobiales bacterium]